MLLGNIWLLSTFVNSSCDIKINIKIVQNCCRNLAVKGLRGIGTVLRQDGVHSMNFTVGVSSFACALEWWVELRLVAQLGGLKISL